MKCGYLPCDSEVEISKKTGRPKKYCCPEHATNEGTRIKKEARVIKKDRLGLNNLHEVDIGRNVSEEVYVENIKHMEKALKGNMKSQEALKTQGLTYHYRKGDGEWGEQREVI